MGAYGGALPGDLHEAHTLAKDALAEARAYETLENALLEAASQYEKEGRSEAEFILNYIDDFREEWEIDIGMEQVSPQVFGAFRYAADYVAGEDDLEDAYREVLEEGEPFESEEQHRYFREVVSSPEFYNDVVEGFRAATEELGQLLTAVAGRGAVHVPEAREQIEESETPPGEATGYRDYIGGGGLSVADIKELMDYWKEDGGDGGRDEEDGYDVSMRVLSADNTEHLPDSIVERAKRKLGQTRYFEGFGGYEREEPAGFVQFSGQHRGEYVEEWLEDIELQYKPVGEARNVKGGDEEAIAMPEAGMWRDVDIPDAWEESLVISGGSMWLPFTIPETDAGSYVVKAEPEESPDAPDSAHQYTIGGTIDNPAVEDSWNDVLGAVRERFHHADTHRWMAGKNPGVEDNYDEGEDGERVVFGAFQRLKNAHYDVKGEDYLHRTIDPEDDFGLSEGIFGALGIHALIEILDRPSPRSQPAPG